MILLDAIVGDTWDRMVYLFRVFPPLLVGIGRHARRSTR